jgi:hypothetical protein
MILVLHLKLFRGLVFHITTLVLISYEISRCNVLFVASSPYRGRKCHRLKANRLKPFQIQIYLCSGGVFKQA